MMAEQFRIPDLGIVTAYFSKQTSLTLSFFLPPSPCHAGLLAEELEKGQDTPVMTERDALSVVFNVTVQIQNPLEEIPGGAAIFFEFRHFKPKKGIRSTRCFSFMEMDEIKPGTIYLEMLVYLCLSTVT